MFGIVLMGILTSCAQGLVGLIGEIFAAITSLFGAFVSPCLGCVQGFEYICSLGVEPAG